LSRRRVVITGLGAIAPVGLSVDEAWANIRAGQGGIRPITGFDTSAFSVRFGGTIEGFEITDYLSSKEARKMDPFIHYGMAAGIQAIRDAGLDGASDEEGRFGVAIGSGIGGLCTIEKNHALLLESGPRKISPFFVPSSIINMISGNLSILHGFRGPNIAMVTACTTGTHNIGQAARFIQYGEADVMVAGGAEMASTPLGLGGFAAARALSTRNDDPATASRPWDKDRDGFVLGDGAGVLVLEELEHARSRGATIYAELIGYGMSGDAHHMTLPAEGGEGAVRCMRAALKDAAIEPAAIDYINAHGTSTQAGDKAETEAIKTTFGEHAYRVAVSSTKSMTGHLLGAAGGVEAVFTALSLRDQVAPPTINYLTPDPDCDLDYVPNMAREMKMDIALSNSFGFGGTNGTIVMRRFAG